VHPLRLLCRNLLPALLLLLPAALRGASVTLDMSTHGVGTFEGVDLPQSSLIRVGTFLLSDSQITSSFNNLAYLNSNFVEFGTTTIGSGYGVDAHANDTMTANTSVLGGVGGTIENDYIYLWIFDAANLASVTQHGVFRSTNSTWRFPLQSSIPNTTIIDLNEVNTDSSGILIGGYGTGISDAALTPLYNLAKIPEPASAAALLATCAGALTRRKRRIL
jgi:hypothetical protein